MGSPSNGIYIIQGELSLVVTAMRRSSRWSSHSQRDDDGDPLFSSFSQLKDILNNITGRDLVVLGYERLVINSLKNFLNCTMFVLFYPLWSFSKLYYSIRKILPFRKHQYFDLFTESSEQKDIIIM